MAPALAAREPLSFPLASRLMEPCLSPKRAMPPYDNDDLARPDLGQDAQNELLQTIKALDDGPDMMSPADADAIFPLSGFDLPEAAELEGDEVEEAVSAAQVRLERRCAFLQRRLRILQARAIGKRVSEEVAQTFERSSRGARKDGCGRPMGMKAFLKRVETTAALQANSASKTVVGPKYFHTGRLSTVDATRLASIGVPSGTLAGLEDTAGALRSHLTVVKRELDSDATLSSSGAESNDEAITYNNQHQRQMPIEKRALWKFQRARGFLASRWCWLQTQVQELEYKIRQHSDLLQQVRIAKGAIELQREPSAYEGPLPGSEDGTEDTPVIRPEVTQDEEETCARVRPLKRSTFKKRKLLQMHNLHVATAKAAKPSDIRCGCCGAEGCAVCTGSARAAAPEPCGAHASASASRLERLLPCYHSVLSRPADVPPSLQVSSLLTSAWFRPRAPPRRSAAPAPPRPLAPVAPVAPVPRCKRGRPPLNRKARDNDTDTHEPSGRGRGRASAARGFDIDNIVIPHSVAAATRPEILLYKEILTPKWRVLELPTTTNKLNNGGLKSHSEGTDSEEDMSEEAVLERHARAEARERARYSLHARRRRAAPPPAPPLAPPLAPAPAPAVAVAVAPAPLPAVPPYAPRRFPLSEREYGGMLQAPAPTPPTAPTPTAPAPTPPTAPTPPAARAPSPAGSASPTPFDGDDPDDEEWAPQRPRHR